MLKKMIFEKKNMQDEIKERPANMSQEDWIRFNMRQLLQLALNKDDSELAFIGDTFYE